MLRETINRLKFASRSKRKSSTKFSVESLRLNERLYADVKSAKFFNDPIKTLEFALHKAKDSGIALEFGVYKGRTLQIIARSFPGKTFGFDSFAGLPEFWREGFPEGTFKLEKVPEFRNAKVYPGLFQETLVDFIEQCSSDISFIHIDADLYSSTKFLLTHLNELIKPGTIILFDEFMNYPNFENHEYRAYLEWCVEFRRECVPIAFTDWHEQMAFEVIS